MKDLSDRYLVFSVDRESYGVPISKVHEVIRFVEITSLHESDRFLKGVINLRGRIIPVIDLRLKFGISETAYNDRTIFIIVEIYGSRESSLIGIVVDSVHEVVHLADEMIERSLNIGIRLKSQHIHGIAQFNGTLLMILDLDKMLSPDEVAAASQLSQGASY